MAAKTEKHARVKNLKCLKKIYEYLVAGYPATALAKKIQEDYKEARDVARDTLINNLKAYRADINPADKLCPRFPHIVMEAEKQFADKLEELKRFEVILEANMYRFDMLHALERVENLINPDLDKVQSNIIKILGSMHQIKMDLGISGSRDLGTVTLSAERMDEVKRKYGESAARALADPVKRSKVMAVVMAAEKEMQMRGSKGSIIDAEFESTPV